MGARDETEQRQGDRQPPGSFRQALGGAPPHRSLLQIHVSTPSEATKRGLSDGVDTASIEKSHVTPGYHLDACPRSSPTRLPASRFGRRTGGTPRRRREGSSWPRPREAP